MINPQAAKKRKVGYKETVIQARKELAMMNIGMIIDNIDGI
jgi:hypothetical protein